MKWHHLISLAVLLCNLAIALLSKYFEWKYGVMVFIFGFIMYYLGWKDMNLKSQELMALNKACINALLKEKADLVKRVNEILK